MLHVARYPRSEIVTETESDIICNMQLAVLITDTGIIILSHTKDTYLHQNYTRTVF